MFFVRRVEKRKKISFHQQEGENGDGKVFHQDSSHLTDDTNNDTFLAFFLTLWSYKFHSTLLETLKLNDDYLSEKRKKGKFLLENLIGNLIITVTYEFVISSCG